MIDLSNATLIGKGLHRDVYIHPDNPEQCIKIVVNGDAAETKREQAYYHLLQKRQISWTMLPKFYGNVDTSLGRGAVFDLIHDSNGQPSHTVAAYLQQKELDTTLIEELIFALIELKQYLAEQRIVTMALKPKNIVLQRLQPGHSRCWIIDNVGNSELLPLSNYLRFFYSKKLERRWDGLKRILINEFAEQASLVRQIVGHI